MLLFQKRFQDGLVSGAISLTFRAWPKLRVKVGGRYRCHPIGVLEVTAVERVKVGTITDDEAKRAGFDDRAALLADLAKWAKQPLDDDAELVKIALHHAGDGDRVGVAMDDALTPEDVKAITAKLRGFDERSERPWTSATLRVIETRPRVAASQLAKSLRRETQPFKADVVKLKKLGLTQSFEVGYELSPRGAAYVAMRKRKPKATK